MISARPLLIIPLLWNFLFCSTTARAQLSIMPECTDGANALFYLQAPQTCIEPDENGKRCWYTYTPKSIKPRNLRDSKGVPLVIDLHGYKGCASWSNIYTGWKDLAQEHGFVTVWPQGTIESGILFSHTCWDAGEGCCCHRFRHQEVDDVGFLTKMIANIIETSSVPIDPTRVYLAGHSNGCMMAQRMAAETQGLIAAVACHAGVLVMDDLPPTDNYQPTPLLMVFGDADEEVPYEGGGPDQFRGALETMELWSEANHCKVGERIDDESDLYARHVHTACDEDVTIEMIQVYDVGHFPYKDAKFFFQEGTSVDTTAMAWDFLRQYRTVGSSSSN